MGTWWRLRRQDAGEEGGKKKDLAPVNASRQCFACCVVLQLI